MRALVLVVDDEASVRQAFSEALSRADFAVEVAPDGASAIRALAARRFDLVITDILMPNGDGFEVITDVRRISTELPVIALSETDFLGRLDLLQVALGLGANRALRKPVDADRLVSEAERLVAAPSRSRAQE